jgi:uncharacterized UPF0146 family protein
VRSDKNPDVNAETRDALVTRLAAFDTLVEVGVGNQFGVAAALADRGKRVTASDIYERDPPAGVAFVHDDVTMPDRAVYADADAIYALDVPPDLHRSIARLARDVDAAFLFTTLGSDQPAVPVERETLPGETLYVAHQSGPDA